MKMGGKTSSFVIIALLFFIALFIRLYKLDSVPNAMHNDEVANTYAGRFILENKKDMFGNSFPLLYVDKFGDYPPSLPMYVSAIGTYLFGINEFGSRFTIALFGASILIPFFLVCQLIYNNLLISGILGLYMVFLPWHVVLSRVNAEGIIALTLYAWGLLLILNDLIIHKNKRTYTILFVICLTFIFLLTYFLYPSYRIFTPLTLFICAIFTFIKNQKNKFILYFFLFILFCGLTLIISQSTWGQGRFKQTSIFNEVSGVQLLINQLNFNEPSIISARIFNNKAFAYSYMFLKQYLMYFSPDFLFFQGGYSKAYTVPYTGLIFITFVLIFFSGAYYLTTKIPPIKKPFIYLILSLLFLSPIPSALTFIETPNIHRSLVMSFFITLIIGAPLSILTQRKNRKVILIILLISFFEVIFFLHNYFQHASLSQSIYRSDGNKEVAMYIIQNKNRYKGVYVTNQESWLPANYLLYSKNFSPLLINRFEKDFRIPKETNVYFPDAKCPHIDLFEKLPIKDKLNHKLLFILPEDCTVNQEYMRELTVIKRVDATTAFKIFETR